MNQTEKKLVENRLAWKVNGVFWKEKDLEECLETSYTNRLDASGAKKRAEKIIEWYTAKNKSRGQKRASSRDARIWDRRFDEDLDTFVEDALDNVNEYQMAEMIQYLSSP